jgi:pimeloyl-ACP methyl ester carboxylesterase
MYVDVLGPEDAPDLVLLHGGIGTGRYHWGKQADALAERFRVHLPDLPGHGRTPPPDGEYTREALVGALSEYLDRLGGGAHVGGFSMGGHTALALAEKEPTRFSSLALVGVAIAHHDGLDAWRHQFDPDVLADAYPMWARHLSKLHAEIGGPEAWRDVCRRDSGGLEVHVDPDRLAHMGAPALLIRGDRDPVVDPDQYARLRQAWPQADEAVVPAGRHDIQITRAGLVRPVLADFYDRVLEG